MIVILPTGDLRVESNIAAGLAISIVDMTRPCTKDDILLAAAVLNPGDVITRDGESVAISPDRKAYTIYETYSLPGTDDDDDEPQSDTADVPVPTPPVPN